MNGVVKADGLLMVVREGVLKTMYCPYAADQFCGNWCPLFDDSNKAFGVVRLCNDNTIYIMEEKKEK